VAADDRKTNLYDFWSFVPIPMNDVLEDGVPPDQRARPQPLHYNLEIVIGDGKHFPLPEGRLVPSMNTEVAGVGGPVASLTFHDQVLWSRG
jgi:hypothetical protein